MNKTVPHPSPFFLRLAGILARLRAAVKFEVPVGYQDETGFHYGRKPARKNTKFPPVW